MKTVGGVAALVASLSFLASCAALPTSDKVKTFGEAAAASSSALKDALSANRMIALQTSREREAASYMTGKPYLLRMDEVDRSNVLQAREQLAVLSALDNYANALVRAADQGVIDELESASQRLATAAGAIGQTILPTASPIIGPAAKVTGRLGGLALGNAYAAEIQSIIVATDPTVQKVATTMPASLSAIARFATAQMEGYEVQRQVTLDAVQRDRGVDKLEMYKEYLIARSDVETLQVQADALKTSGGVFEQLAEAHHALATGTPDAATLVKKFSDTATDISELISAVRATRGTK